MTRHFAVIALAFLCATGAHAAAGDLVTTVTNPFAAPGDLFGYSLNLYRSTLIVGAPMSDGSGTTDSGMAVQFDAGGLPQRAYLNPDSGEGDQFGISIANNGYVVAIGAPFHDSAAADAGAVYLFNASTGAFQRKIECPSAQGGEFFGRSVALSGRNLLVGAPGDDENGPDAGALYLFNTSDGRLVQTMKAPPTEWYFFRGLGDQVAIAGRYFGGTSPAGDRFIYFDRYGKMIDRGSPCYSFASYRTFFVVGAIDTDHPYARHAYKYNPAYRYAVQFYKDPTFESEDDFGFSIAADVNRNARYDRVIVGAPEESTTVVNEGAAHVFNNRSGVYEYTITNPDPQEHARFGWSVALGTPGAVVGAPFADTEAGEDSGAAYLFLKY
jgi:hypothetical protein